MDTKKIVTVFTDFSLKKYLFRVEKGIKMTMIDWDIAHGGLLLKVLGFLVLATTY